MLLYQRLCMILAQEGITGLYRRARRKVSGDHANGTAELDAEIVAAQHEYVRLQESFTIRAQQLGLAEGVRDFYWYHTIDLGDGLVTPGDYDYRPYLRHYEFPDSLTGMNVLDIGSATGFFAFELERRGANVTSVELPALSAWDMVSCERDRILRGITERCHAADAEQAYHRVLDGPFQFCRERLKSGVRRHHGTIYALSPEKLGTDGFDLVMLGDVFSHLLAPLPALDVLAGLCRGRLILVLDLVDDAGQRPLLEYVADPEGSVENRSWWVANFACVERMLQTVGFRKVEIAGQFSGVLRRCWQRFRRFVVHATK